MNNETDFIHTHNTKRLHGDKYKIEYFPTDGDELRAVRQEMLLRFKQTQMMFELDMFWDKQQWAQDSDFWAWFGASRQRTSLFHAFNLQGHSDGWTVNKMAEFIKRDRSSVSKELTECHTHGFIYRDKSEGKQRHYHASERLINNGNWYTEYFVDKQLAMDEYEDRSAFFLYRKTEREHFERTKKRGSLSQKI